MLNALGHRPELSLDEHHRLRDVVHKHFGIQVSDEKKVIVMNRMGHYLVNRGFESYTQFLDRLDADLSGALLDDLATLISTNHTYFFRDESHFSMLRSSVWPELEREALDRRTTDLRIWCAASSTGEEAYSILFTLLEHFGPRYSNFQAGLLATDISPTVLEHASRGVYDETRASVVPQHMRDRFMRKFGDRKMEVLPELRKEVHFGKFNLMTPVFPFKKPFHVIFCRNVMIYFDQPTRTALIRRLIDCLVPGGLLFVGTSEAIHGEPGLDYVSPTVFRRKAGGDRR